ncbi:GNAT family N-acetyltransferase [Bacillus velezensis]
MDKKKLDLSKIKVRLIQQQDHQSLKKFKCGNASLERYLQQDAYYDTIDSVSSTNLVFFENVLVGYFTLKHMPLSLNVFPSDLEFPYCLDIARIAVDEKFQKQGIGTKMLNIIKTLAKTTNERFLTLDALIEKHDWYSNRGFDSFIEDEVRRSNIDGIVYMVQDLYDQESMDAYLEDAEIV